MNYFKLSDLHRLTLALISGALVMLWAQFEDVSFKLFFEIDFIDIMIGITFGVLVMVPFQKSFHPFKSIALMLASVVIYIAMVRLTVEEYGFLNLKIKHAILVSGTLGALLTGVAVKFLASIATRKRFFGYLFAAGSFAGFVFSYTIDSQSIFMNAIGYMLWQGLVCWAMINGRK